MISNIQRGKAEIGHYFCDIYLLTNHFEVKYKQLDLYEKQFIFLIKSLSTIPIGSDEYNMELEQIESQFKIRIENNSEVDTSIVNVSILMRDDYCHGKLSVCFAMEKSGIKEIINQIEAHVTPINPELWLLF